MSFESSISTTSTSKIHATSIFSSSNGNASDGDDEEEDFLYYSSATDQDIPQRTFTLPFATGLKRKYSHRSIGSHNFLKKKSSNGSFGIRTKTGSLPLAPFPPRDSDLTINSISTLDISEETRLLDNPDVEQGMNQEKIQKKSSMILIVSTIALALTILAAIVLVSFSIQPLQLTGVTDMKVITRTVHLFELNIFLEGFNPNIVSINLNETDLDIYASRGINTLLQIPNLDIFPQPAVINTVTRQTEEILGHIRSFNSSIDDLTFKPLSNQLLGPKISIIDPSNTIGRFIYMTFPFTIIIRGGISYNSPLDLVKSTIPVCMYQHLLSENEVSTYSCLFV